MKGKRKTGAKPKLINSCADCKFCCCRCGPGPYKLLSPEDYLEDFGAYHGYNTQCLALNEDNTCRIWGTPKLPVACRAHVCSNKIFTKEELETIEKIDDDAECNNCGAPYMLFTRIGKKAKWHRSRWECELCGQTNHWKAYVVRKGKDIGYKLEEEE
jgi:hypothetical protein